MKQLGMSTLGIILLVLVLLMLFGAWSALEVHHYGYAPSGILFVALIVVLVLILTKRI